MKLVPVPVVGVPPGADQLKVYGEVPPVAEAWKVTGVPAVPVVGPVTARTIATGLIVMLAVLIWLWCGVAESVPLTLILYVPFTL